jgi:hypothetical protein
MQVGRDVATCMYYPGIDPFSKKTVHVARDLRDRLKQRALMQFFKPKNWFTTGYRPDRKTRQRRKRR